MWATLRFGNDWSTYIFCTTIHCWANGWTIQMCPEKPGQRFRRRNLTKRDEKNRWEQILWRSDSSYQISFRAISRGSTHPWTPLDPTHLSITSHEGGFISPKAKRPVQPYANKKIWINYVSAEDADVFVFVDSCVWRAESNAFYSINCCFIVHSLKHWSQPMQRFDVSSSRRTWGKRSKRGERKKQGNGREIVKKGVKEKYRGREWANEYGKHIDWTRV